MTDHPTEEPCAFEGCGLPAITLALGARRGKIAKYCDTHASVVSNEHSPEYIVDCPHCGCRFGVN